MLTVATFWERMFSALVQFKTEHGHCDVPAKWSENPQLGKWTNNQRTVFKRGELSSDRLERLEAIGFDWDPVATFWERMFSALARFKEEHGHCDVPQGWSENPQLGKWTNRQRTVFKRGELSPDRLERLEVLGFNWGTVATFRERMFSELARFKEEHGHCDVPVEWSENPQLGKWINRQRVVYRRGGLSPDRVERLDALGFEWGPHAARWEKRFSALVRFKEEHGHCDVPVKLSDPELGRWVTVQRVVYRRGGLSPDRVERLEALGFEWDAIAALWEKRFSELVRFKKEHSHCDVPRAWSKNPVLGNWVGTQRSRSKKGRMTDARRSRLEEIGFRF